MRNTRGGHRIGSVKGGVRMAGIALDEGADRGLLADIATQARAYYLTRRHELAPLVPRAERATILEAPWQRRIIEVATRLGWWSHHPHLSKFSSRGVPDLFLLRERTTEAAWIEVKTDSNELSEDQVEVIDRMLACGLRVGVFRPHDTLEAVARWLA